MITFSGSNAIFVYHCLEFQDPFAKCLKITEKVSFNIASEASYVYILSGQKLIKNAKNGPFWRVFENRKLAVKQCYQTGQFWKDKNWWKMPNKFKNSNVTFWVIFKQCEALLKRPLAAVLQCKQRNALFPKMRSGFCLAFCTSLQSEFCSVTYHDAENCKANLVNTSPQS